MVPGCGSHRLSPSCMASGGGLLPSFLLSLQVLESYHCGSRHGVFIYPTQFFWGPWTSSYFKSDIPDTCVLPPPLSSLREWLDPNRRFQGSFACLSASFLKRQPLLSPFLLHAAWSLNSSFVLWLPPAFGLVSLLSSKFPWPFFFVSGWHVSRLPPFCSAIAVLLPRLPFPSWPLQVPHMPSLQSFSEHPN